MPLPKAMLGRGQRRDGGEMGTIRTWRIDVVHWEINAFRKSAIICIGGMRLIIAFSLVRERWMAGENSINEMRTAIHDENSHHFLRESGGKLLTLYASLLERERNYGPV